MIHRADWQRQPIDDSDNGEQYEYEYGVIMADGSSDTIITRAWAYKECLQWIVQSTIASRYTIVRRHTNSNVWRTDWEDD